MTDKSPAPPRVDWRAADLRNVSFAGVSLEGADMRASDLSGASFTGANLRYADLRGAKCVGTSFHNANLYGAKLQGIEALGADFRLADMRQVNIAGAYLEGAMMPATDAQMPRHASPSELARDAGPENGQQHADQGKSKVMEKEQSHGR